MKKYGGSVKVDVTQPHPFIQWTRPERRYTCMKCNAPLFVENSWQHRPGQVGRVYFEESTYPLKGTEERDELNDKWTSRWRIQEIALSRLDVHVRGHDS